MHAAPEAKLHVEIGKVPINSNIFSARQRDTGSRDQPRGAVSPHYTCSVGSPSCLNYATVNATVNGKGCKALIDSGSSKSYMHFNMVKELKLRMEPC